MKSSKAATLDKIKNLCDELRTLQLGKNEFSETGEGWAETFAAVLEAACQAVLTKGEPRPFLVDGVYPETLQIASFVSMGLDRDNAKDLMTRYVEKVNEGDLSPIEDADVPEEGFSVQGVWGIEELMNLAMQVTRSGEKEDRILSWSKLDLAQEQEKQLLQQE